MLGIVGQGARWLTCLCCISTSASATAHHAALTKPVVVDLGQALTAERRMAHENSGQKLRLLAHVARLRDEGALAHALVHGNRLGRGTQGAPIHTTHGHGKPTALHRS